MSQKIQKALRESDTVYYIAAFIASYILMLALNYFLLKNYSPWDSIMYYLYIVPGFFFAVLLIPWINAYTNTRIASTIYFPIALLFLAYIAYFTVIVWYYNNIAALSNIDGFSFNKWFSADTEYVFKQMIYQSVGGSFTKFFLASALGAYTISAALGWLSHIGLRLRQGKNPELFQLKAR